LSFRELKEFEVFWKLYPKRWDRNRSRLIKRKKFPAWESWQKLDSDTQHEILTKAKYIKEFEGGSARDAVTWLNQRGWDDVDFPDSWVPRLPKELTDVCEAPEEDHNDGRRRTLLLRQTDKLKAAHNDNLKSLG
jgi:hypothetical protein